MHQAISAAITAATASIIKDIAEMQEAAEMELEEEEFASEGSSSVSGPAKKTQKLTVIKKCGR